MAQAIRGTIVTCTGNPFQQDGRDALCIIDDGLVVMEDGLITAVGDASGLLPGLPADIPVDHYEDSFIIPGFIDCHVHYPQTEVIGAYGAQLIDWLNDYTFIAEQKFSDFDYAKAVATVFLREALRAGTTTATVFCTVDPESVNAFFEVSDALNMRNIAGKVLMDRNAPAALTDTPQQGYDQTKDLIAKWHNKGRQLYCVTPRFAPTSSPEQMDMTGAVWVEHPGTWLQSHVSENLDEIKWVGDLFPNCKSYVDVYDHYGHLGPRSIMGHAVHLDERDFQTFHDTGTAIAHCPTSNLFLGSGLFSIEQAMKADRPVRVGLATDLGGGTSFSHLVTMNEAYKIAQMGGYSLSAIKAFYLSTLGAANALYLDDKLGSIEVGKEADITVLDKKATPVQAFRTAHAKTFEEQFFVMMMMGDDRNAAATYVAGDCVYRRGSSDTDDVFTERLG